MQNPESETNDSTDIHRLQKELDALTIDIQNNPNDPNYYYRRGVVNGQLIEPLAAIRDFTEVIRLDPGNAEAYYNRGLAHIHLKEHLPAVEDFTEAIKLDPNHLDAYNNRAASLCDLGRPRDALLDVEKVIEIDDTVASAYAIKALANTYLGDDIVAKEAVDRASKLGFEGPLLRHFVRQAQRQRRSIL